jgi:hypothetical protein
MVAQQPGAEATDRQIARPFHPNGNGCQPML